MDYAESMKAIENVAQFHLKQGHGKYSREIFRAMGGIREHVDGLEKEVRELRAAIKQISNSAYEAGKRDRDDD